MAKIAGVHFPSEQKNLAINGALDYWQEKVGSTSTVNTATTVVAWSADMWKYESGGATTKNYSLVRSSDVPTFSQAGFTAPFSNLFTMLTGIASPAAGDYVIPFEYLMEGTDYAKLQSKTITLGFWVKASIAGTYSLALTNGTFNRSYLTTFAISGANAWEFKSITVTLDTTGTWAFDKTAGLRVYIGGVTGSTYQTASLNAWQAGGFLSASGTTNWQATTNATLRVALFSIVEGSLGFSAVGFQRAGKNTQQELAMCQKYYEKSYDPETLPGTVTDTGRIAFHSATGIGAMSNLSWISFEFKVTKRDIPTVAPYASSAANQTPRFSDSAGTTRICSASEVGTQRWSWKHGDPSSTTGIFLHYTADARL